MSETNSPKVVTPQSPTKKYKPSSIISSDIDVPLDWLYKGKRKSRTKAASLSKTSSHGSSTAKIRSNSSGQSSSSLSPYSSNNKSKSTSNDLLPAPTQRRTRSQSITNGMIAQPLPNIKQQLEKGPIASLKNDHLRSRSSSISGTSSSQISTDDSSPLKRSVSLSEKPKKSLLGSIFGRRLSNQSHNKQKQQQPSPIQTTNINTRHPKSSSSNVNSPLVKKLALTPEESPITIFNKSSKEDVDDALLNTISNISLRRVKFSVDKFTDDPPQQLPSRKPKLGDVLIPNDMISEVPPISVGITTTDNNSGSTLITNQHPMYTKDSKEYKIALERYKKSLKEGERHQEEAQKAAERIAREVYSSSRHRANSLTSSLTKTTSNTSSNPLSKQNSNELDTKVDVKAKTLSIDKPIHMHQNNFGDDFSTHNTNEVTLDVIYTRCCHLREILPIPSTLRQVKGKTAPLQTLKFLNPRPTLIDILSFCDFISIIPIHTIVFDNVALTSEMFRIVLSSIVNSNVLEKLGLRNVTIDEEDWKIFCKFLIDNKSLIKLDISQTKIRPESSISCYRENMDWSLFCQVLKRRKGKPLEELLLNGVKFNRIPLGIFQDLLHVFAKMNPKTNVRLGLAVSDISLGCLKILFPWMSKYSVEGVDLAFNNLADLLKPIIESLSTLDFKHLKYFTLNSTNISSVDDMALLIKYLSKLPNLQFLDLSNLPQLFPNIIPDLHKYLPQFPSLKRIYFENNDLTYREISMICNILQKCKLISHVSLLSQHPPSTLENENHIDTELGKDDSNKDLFNRHTLWATLYSLARSSPNLVSLDIDYDELSEEMRSRIALCLMRNMQRTMDSSFELDEASFTTG